MEGKTKKLAGNAVIYGFFGLLQKGLGFFLLPVYASFLATDELGIISNSTAVIAFLVILFGLSLRGSTAYFYYKYKDENPNYLRRFFGTNLSFILLVTVLGIGLVLLSRNWILAFLFKNIPFEPYVILALISVLLQPVYLFYQSILKAKHKAKKASLLDFMFFGVMATMTSILIIFFDYGAEGALASNALASLLVFSVSLFGLRKEVNFCLDWSILKVSLKYSLPILPHNLSGWAMNMVDKLMLNNINSLTAVALFDVGAQIGKVVNLISLGVNSAYSPWFFEQVRNNSDSDKLIARVTNKIILIYALVAIAVSWLSPEILQVMSKPAYHESWQVVPFISTAFVINGFYFTYSNVFFLEKTKYLPFLTMTGAAINLTLNFILIPAYGIYGAAVASLITKVFFTLLTYIICQRLHPIEYDIGHLLVLFTLTFLFSSLPFLTQDYIGDMGLFTRITMKGGVLLLFIAPIAYYNRSNLRELIRK